MPAEVAPPGFLAGLLHRTASQTSSLASRFSRHAPEYTGWLAGRVCGGSRIERCRQRQYFAAVKSGSCCSTFSFNFEVASPRCSPRRCRDVVVCARLFLGRCERFYGVSLVFSSFFCSSIEIKQAGLKFYSWLSSFDSARSSCF